MSTKNTVSDYMLPRKDLVTVTPHMDIAKAIEIFVTHKISGAPVVDDQGALIGMLSEADCIDSYLQCAYNSSGAGCGSVVDNMSTDLTTLEASADIIEAGRMFIDKRLRRIPIIQNGTLVGQLTRHNLLKAIHDNDWA